MRRVAASVGAVVAVVICMAGAVAPALAQQPLPIPHQRVVAGSGGSLLGVSTDGSAIRTTRLLVDGPAGPAPSTEVVAAAADELVANPVAAWNPTAQRYLLIWQRLDAGKTLQAIAYTWLDLTGIAVGSPGIVATIEPDAYGHRPPVHDPHSEPLTASCSSAADACLVSWNDSSHDRRDARILHAGDTPASAVVAVGAQVYGGGSGYPLVSSACAPDGGSCAFVSSSPRLRVFVVTRGSESVATVDLGRGSTSPVVTAGARDYTIAWSQLSRRPARQAGVWAAKIDDSAGVLSAPHMISRHVVSDAVLGLTALPALAPFVLFVEDERVVAVRTDRDLNDPRGQAVIDTSGANPLGSTAAALGTPDGDVITTYASVVADPAVAFRGVRDAITKLAQARDRLAPWVEAEIRNSRRNRSALDLSLYCDERCTVRGRVGMRLGGEAFTIAFRTSIASPAAQRRVRFRIGSRTRARLTNQLYAGNHVELTVNATARDAAGNLRTVTANSAYEPPVSVDRPRAPRCEKAPGKTILKQGSTRLYTTRSPGLMFWWACQTGQTRRILIAGGRAGTYVRSTILRRDRLLLVDVGNETIDGTLSTMVLYDLRTGSRRYLVDFLGAHVGSMKLDTDGAAAAITYNGPYATLVAISPSGRTATLTAEAPDDAPKQIGGLRLESGTVFWTEKGVQHSAPVPN